MRATGSESTRVNHEASKILRSALKIGQRIEPAPTPRAVAMAPQDPKVPTSSEIEAALLSSGGFRVSHPTPKRAAEMAPISEHAEHEPPTPADLEKAWNKVDCEDAYHPDDQDAIAEGLYNETARIMGRLTAVLPAEVIGPYVDLAERRWGHLIHQASWSPDVNAYWQGENHSDAYTTVQVVKFIIAAASRLSEDDNGVGWPVATAADAQAHTIAYLMTAGAPYMSPRAVASVILYLVRCGDGMQLTESDDMIPINAVNDQNARALRELSTDFLAEEAVDDELPLTDAIKASLRASGKSLFLKFHYTDKPWVSTKDWLIHSVEDFISSEGLLPQDPYLTTELKFALHKYLPSMPVSTSNIRLDNADATLAPMAQEAARLMTNAFAKAIPTFISTVSDPVKAILHEAAVRHAKKQADAHAGSGFRPRETYDSTQATGAHPRAQRPSGGGPPRHNHGRERAMAFDHTHTGH